MRRNLTAAFVSILVIMLCFAILASCMTLILGNDRPAERRHKAELVFMTALLLVIKAICRCIMFDKALVPSGIAFVPFAAEATKFKVSWHWAFGVLYVLSVFSAFFCVWVMPDKFQLFYFLLFMTPSAVMGILRIEWAFRTAEAFDHGFMFGAGLYIFETAFTAYIALSDDVCVKFLDSEEES